jgi:hypothetical protein
MMRDLLIADVKTIRSWWSVRVGAVGVLLLAGLPALADQIPDLKQVLLGWFPTNGAQWVPAFCIVLTVAARIVSQAAIIDQVRGMFRRKGGEHDPQ